MPQETNCQIVCRWFQELWNERKLETIDRLLAPDAVAHEVIGPQTVLRGPAEFRAAAEQLLKAFGEMHFTVEDVFGQDDRVAIRLMLRLRHTGPLGGLRPSGKSFALPVLCIVRLRDGLLVEGWNGWDVGAVLRAAEAPATQTTLV
jgi:predicted ester cyclase